jgi:MoaA/NifB/PqqE/SkfB family radical SAM enzyme
MQDSNKNIVGVGCDFESETEDKSRKLAIESLSGGEDDKINWMLKNMHKNKAYEFHSHNKTEKEKNKILQDFKDRYVDYRRKWRDQPKDAFKKELYGKKFEQEQLSPLCFDIEIASICDLACAFCYRQYVSTPDKIMKKELAFKLIDQASKLNVPSMKFNWRGEPLLNPQAHNIIYYAKKMGILETIMNSNATKLDNKTAEKIIKSGLDLLIYSFDGGTKNMYEKMRPGRFRKNNFDVVYKNIVNFSKIKKKLKSPFPRTKIQMILTDETRDTQSEYFRLFKNVVDDVSVKQYTERGQKLNDLTKEFEGSLKNKKNDLIKKYGDDATIMKDSKNDLYISTGRLPCEQPFQRVLSTYDGKVGMCCYDWGATHTVGYLDNLAIDNGDKEYQKVKKDSDNKKDGFQMMNLDLPLKRNITEKKVKDLKQIWHGEDINKVREAHVEDKVGDVKVCKYCPFKETYKWEKII